MKKIILLAVLLLSFVNVNAQSPQKMSFQAVIRNSANDLVSNLPIGLKTSILQGSDSGTTIYAETHTANTNVNGLVTIQIGGGNVVEGDFALIEWANGPYFIKTETDITGGTNYTITSTTQLLSVPFALYAQSSGSSTPGPQGIQGEQGPIGLTGPAGANGTNGINGIEGAVGPQGLTGPTGATGPIGQTGAQGPQGLQGLTGATGDTGPQGPQGIQGERGLQGEQGLIGLTGPAGPQGPIGLTGATGPAGAQGPQGLQGLTGATGDAGPQGPQGIQGLTGPAGANGTNGINGANGINGISAYEVWLNIGNNGTEADFISSLTGPQGTAGSNGSDGTNGVDGINTLINTITEPAGANCTNGGTKIEVGLDANNNGALDNNEVNSSLTKYVCNGGNSSQSSSNNTIHGSFNDFNNGVWTVPSGINQVNIMFNGSRGGNGGRVNGPYGVAYPGGTGGESAFISITTNLTVGDIITYEIGTNGIAGADDFTGWLGYPKFGPSGTSGGISKLFINGVLIYTLNGGEGATGGFYADNNQRGNGVNGNSGYLTPNDFNNTGILNYNNYNILSVSSGQILIRY